MPHALLVDDDLALSLGLAEMVSREGFTTSTAGSLREAREEIRTTVPDLVLLDLHLPDGLGVELLEDLAETPATQTVMMTAHGTIEAAVDAMRRGAVHFLTKPLDFAAVKATLATIAHTRQLTDEIGVLRGTLRQLGRFGLLVGASPAMQRTYDLIEKVARTDATVLIVGETGTGKELVAQTIHGLSRRRNESLVAVNCGAVSATLIESELFGHERGSFTGAQRQHRGHFERAHGGTLFLDEITEMSADLQVKLLRVLETGMVHRLGAQDTLPVDVRVIAATNRVPRTAVTDGKLREDLLYRLNVFPIDVPPLRDRLDDVEVLAQHFLSELNRQEGTNKQFTRAAIQRLAGHDWPGNVRELKNVVQRAFILAEDTVGIDMLSLGTTVVTGSSLSLKVGTSLSEVERHLILSTLEHCEGDKKKAAAILGVSLKTVYNKLNEYGVK